MTKGDKSKEVEIKRIYFVRHGQTEANVLFYFQNKDTALTKLGLEQTNLLAKRCKSINAEALITSDYKRALETAELIGKECGLKPEVIELFGEARHPSELDLVSKDDPKVKKIDKDIEAHADDPDWHYSNEENLSDLCARGREILKYLSERSEDSIIVVTHGRLLRVLLTLMLIEPEIAFKQFKHLSQSVQTSNTGITVFSFEKHERWGKDGVWRLLRWNDKNHLG